MSPYNRVLWKEGLFLRPHHFQQNDRYHERLLDARVRHVTPYPWGFSVLEVDNNILGQGKFGLRRASGIMPDGTPFCMPDDLPLPTPIDVPESAAGHRLWLTLPSITPNTRDIDDASAEGASRYVSGSEMLIDTYARTRVEEAIDLALPRFGLEVRESPKPGFSCLGVALLRGIHDKALDLDTQYAPPVLAVSAHPVITGWIDVTLNRILTKAKELDDFATDPSSGGGLLDADYLELQILNRYTPLLRHYLASRYVHPERVYLDLACLAGELATLCSDVRLAREYPHYDHDDLRASFAALLEDIRTFLTYNRRRRRIRLEIEKVGENLYASPIRDRALVLNANLILEVSASRPVTDIQTEFPRLFKIGPSTRMRQIVPGALPGIQLIPQPVPPREIRPVADHVYFLLDRNTSLWQEFGNAGAIGMHSEGKWPDLSLQLWAIQ